MGQVLFYHCKDDWTPARPFTVSSSRKVWIGDAVVNVHATGDVEAGSVVVMHANDVLPAKVGVPKLNHSKVLAHARDNYGDILGSILVTTQGGSGVSAKKSDICIFYWDTIQQVLDRLKRGERFSDIVADLSKGSDVECLSALAILCQGFLAVYAAEHPTDWTPEVLQALRKMGWVSNDSLEIDPDAERLTISQDVDGVSNQEYWLGVFGEFGDGQAVKGTCGRVRSAVETEWGTKDEEGFATFSLSFDALVERLEGLAKPDTPLETIVAEMYCAIAARLEG